MRLYLGCLLFLLCSYAFAQQSQIIIEAYGDSTTVGYQVNNGVSIISPNNEWTLIETYVRADFGNLVKINNHGVGGMEASNLRDGTDGMHQDFENVMAASAARIVVFNFGLGDAYQNRNNMPPFINEGPQDFYQIMAQLTDTARAHGKLVVFEEPNPSCNVYREGLPYYVMQLDQLALDKNVPLYSQYWVFAGMTNWQALLSDCTHPTDALYAMKAKNTYAILKPLIQSLLH